MSIDDGNEILEKPVPALRLRRRTQSSKEFVEGPEYRLINEAVGKTK